MPKLVSLILTISALAAPVGWAAKDLTPLQNDTDPTKPVLFSLRNDYYNLLNNAWINQTTLRADRLVLKNLGLPGGAQGSILRADLPFATVNTGSTSQSGLADCYVQSIQVPRLHKGFTWAYGSGLVIPTATHSLLGAGQWQIAPALVPAQFLPHSRGIAYFKLQDFISFAGEEDRPEVHQFVATPTLLYRFTNRWFGLLDSESRTDWYDHANTSMKSGIETGMMFHSRFGGWIKLEVPWGEHRAGEWTLKSTLFMTRY